MMDLPKRCNRIPPLGLVLLLQSGMLLCLSGVVQAQEFSTPVRRATAVEPTPTPTPRPGYSFDDFENPEWMQQVRPALPATEPEAAPYRPEGYPTPPPPAATAVPIPEAPTVSPVERPAATPVPAQDIPVAIPVERTMVPEPTPAPTPAPTPEPTPRPAATPAADPEPTPVPTPERRPQEDAPGTIRIAPSGETALERPRQIQTAKDYADAFYARKMYDLAAPEYEKFLSEEPRAQGRDAAWFRLAESHRNLGQNQRARDAYRNLLREFPSGEFAGAGAYRLGGILMEENAHADAARSFEIAAREATDPAVRLSALFFAARSLELAGDHRKAYELFERVRNTSDADDRYVEFSLGAMARMAIELNRNRAAIQHFQELAEKTESSRLRAEARVKAAELLMEEEQFAEARKLLEAVAADRESEEWGKAARAGLLELHYQEGSFETVAGISMADLDAYPPETRARAKLLVAHSHRQIGNFGQALEIYDALIEEFPDSATARDARFHRLVCLFRAQDPRLLDALNRFLLEASDPVEQAQARLLKAETHYAAEQWRDAANSFGNLRNSPLPAHLREDAGFKYAWCLARLGDSQKSVLAYSEFLQSFPDSDYVPQALIGRGMVHLENGAHDAATRDFDRVVQDFAGTSEREFALLQRGLTWGARKDYKKMQSDFEMLIEEYPETAARAQAEFWIGYAKFEEKNYEGALPHFAKARELDEEAYGARAAMRSMLANYYLENVEGTAREVDSGKIPNVPAEVYQWLAAKALESGDNQKAERFLQTLLDGAAGDSPGPELYLQLAESRIQQGKYDEAVEPVRSFLGVVRDPAPRARGFLTKAKAEIGGGNYEQAREAVEEAQTLQPEGRINAEARMVAGEIYLAQNEYESAAKTFLTVAVLYDDEILAPRALLAAADAYKKANNPAEAARALEELQRRYPQSAQVPAEG